MDLVRIIVEKLKFCSKCALLAEEIGGNYQLSIMNYDHYL